MLKKIFKVIVLVVVAIVLVLLVKKARVKIAQIKKRLASAPEFSQLEQLVELTKAKKGNLVVKIPYFSYVETSQNTFVASQIPGRIIFLNKNEGDVVKKGEIIAKLDDRELQTNLLAQQEKLSSLKSEIKATISLLEGAKTGYYRWKKEYQRDSELRKKGVIPQTALDATYDKYMKAKSNYDSIKNKINALRAQLKSIESLIEGIKVKISYTQICAPFDGSIAKKHKEIGDVVMPGQPIYELLDYKHLKLVWEAVQDDLSFIKKGMSVETEPIQIKNLKITTIYPRLSRNRMAKIECDFVNSNEKIIPGMSLMAWLIVKEYKDKVIIPEDALIVNNDGSYGVFIYRKGKKPIYREVKLAKIFREKAVIDSGIEDGDKLVVGSYLQWLRINKDLKMKAICKEMN